MPSHLGRKSLNKFQQKITKDKAMTEQRNPELKGVKGGNCNREACQKPGAVWFNHSTHAYYCPSCAELLNNVNRDWAVPQYGHELCTKEEDQ